MISSTSQNQASKALLLLSTLALCFTGAAHAAPDAQPGVVHMAVSRRTTTDGAESEQALRSRIKARRAELVPRAGTITESLVNNVTGGSYMAVSLSPLGGQESNFERSIY